MIRLKGSRLPGARKVLLAAGVMSTAVGLLQLHGPQVMIGVTLVLVACTNSAWMTAEEAHVELEAVEKRRTEVLLDAYAQRRVTPKHRLLRLWLYLTMDPYRYKQFSEHLSS